MISYAKPLLQKYIIQQHHITFLRVFLLVFRKKLFFCYVTGTNSPNPKPTHLRKCFIMFHDLSKKLLFIKKKEKLIWLLYGFLKNIYCTIFVQYTTLSMQLWLHSLNVIHPPHSKGFHFEYKHDYELCNPTKYCTL